jgi:hypothetical protein
MSEIIEEFPDFLVTELRSNYHTVNKQWHLHQRIRSHKCIHVYVYKLIKTETHWLSVLGCWVEKNHGIFIHLQTVPQQAIFVKQSQTF